MVAAFEAQDGARLAELAHPEKGVRFSPYAFVDAEKDVVLSPRQLEGFWSDDTVFEWGSEDGSGEPIRMSASQYCDRYIMDRDFAAADQVSENQDKASGNTVNNAAEVYPDGTRVEYYIKPTMTDGQPNNDWAALRIVLENSQGTWRLVGVIHDEWTI